MEDVWQYPRPPALVPCDRRVRIVFADHTIADTTSALRVLETSHPPTIYIPPADVVDGVLRPVRRTTFCEWKGHASYFDVVAGDRVEPAAAWTFHAPTEGFAVLRDHIAVYPGRMDACFLDEEQVQSQEGDFYGGWITADLKGPFKGAAGTWDW